MSETCTGLVRAAAGSVCLRTKRQHILVMMTLHHAVASHLAVLVGLRARAALVVGASAGHAVGSIGAIMRRLDHRRKLQLLVIRVVALVTSMIARLITLSIAEDLFVELHHLVHLMMALRSGRR